MRSEAWTRSISPPFRSARPSSANGRRSTRRSASAPSASTWQWPVPRTTAREPHDEVESAQEELFVVVAGRARFVVGDETIDAGPGTAVGVGDPALKRGFQALEPGTRVLCIGAQPPNQPARWGYWISGGEP